MREPDLAFENDQIVKIVPPEYHTEDLADELADEIGITKEQSATAIQWFKSRQKDDVFHAAADLLSKSISSILDTKQTLRIVGLRTIALILILQREEARTVSAMAARYKVSKQTLSHHHTALADILGLKSAHAKTARARKNMKFGAKEMWSKLTTSERIERRRRKAQSTLHNT